MRKIGVLPFIIIVLLAGYYVTFPSWTVRHRWTYEVEVDGKVHTGSGVMETTTSTGLLCGGPGIGYPCQSFRGEAVPIDLGSRGIIFALLVSPNGGDSHVMLMPEKIANRMNLTKSWSVPGKDTRVTTWAGLAQNGLKADLLPEEIPMLVRFRDVNDPKTIERLEPAKHSTMFVSAARLIRASIETTSDDVTIGIASFLHWLPLPKDKTTTLFLTRDELERFSTLPPERRLAEYAYMRYK
jgi:hypothetical protein